MPRSLRSQVQALSVMPILGLAAAVILSSLLLTHFEVDAQAGANLHEVSNLLSRTTRERDDALTAQAKLIADLPTLKSAVQSRDDPTIQDRADYYLKRTQADALIVTDDDGRVLAAAGFVRTKRLDANLRHLVAEASSGQSGTQIVNQDGKLYSAASTPIYLRDYPIGTLTALSLVGDQLAGDLKKATSADVLFLAGGRVVGATLPVKGLAHINRDQPWRVRLNKHSYLAWATSLPGSGHNVDAWLVALKDYDELAVPYRMFSSSLIVLILLVLLIAVTLARAFAHGLSKPLDALVKNAQVIRDGEWPDALEVEREDEIGFLQSVFNDMTANLRKSRERILSLVDTDPLTELDNHRRFKERLDQEVFRACMSGKPLVLALIDLDKFAEYNAEHGHVTGDNALKTMGRLLNEIAPDIAFLARYGGEEFAILLPLNTLDAAESLLLRLRELSHGRFDAPLTFSIGLADVKPGITTGAGLLLSAEMALSRAKQLGRDRICRFDSVPGASSADDPFQLQQYLQDTTLATIQALAGAVDAKDPYTQGHSVRVARYAADLARFMGFEADFIDLVYKTATLHDVGKIGVPDSILAKPSRLDLEEQAIMETHPVLGELIVKKAPQLEEMLPGVRHHHERWDGQGYPDKLSGRQIPVLARIIAVADTFDAMTSDRPYRRALPEDIALEEIRRKAGHQFDPEMSENFVRMMRLHHHGMMAA